MELVKSIDVALGEPRGAGANITASAHSTLFISFLSSLPNGKKEEMKEEWKSWEALCVLRWAGSEEQWSKAAASAANSINFFNLFQSIQSIPLLTSELMIDEERRNDWFALLLPPRRLSFLFKEMNWARSSSSRFIKQWRTLSWLFEKIGYFNSTW